MSLGRRCLSGLPLVVLSLAAAVAPAAEPDKYLPEDTDAVLVLNVRQVFDSAVFKKNYLPLIQAELKTKPELQNQFKEIGFDPLRDIDRLVIATGESVLRTDSKGEMGALVILRGKFDVAKVHAKLAQLAPFVGKLLQIHKKSTGIVYELNLEGRSIFFALPERGTLVAATQQAPVQDALDKGAGRKKATLKHKDVATLIAKTDGKQAAWVVATGRATVAFDPGPKNEKNSRRTLADSGVDEVSGGFWVTDGVKAAFGVKVQNEAAATAVSDALQTELAKAVDKGFDGAFDEKRLAPLREFLKEMVIAGDGKHIVIQSEVPGRVFAASVKKD
jgi:hypothetical protein